MKKTVLLLGNTFSETDFINILKTRYSKIITLSSTQPFNKGKKITHITLDYKDYKGIKKVIKKYRPVHIFPGSNDLTLFSLSKCRIKNHFLDSYKKLFTLHNKIEFRKFYKQIFFFNSIKKLKNINIPKSSFPILAKPHVGSGGKNIVKLNNYYELSNFYKEKKGEKYLFEKYFVGSNHGVFTLIKKGKIIFNFFDTEQRYKNPFTVSSTISYCNISNLNKKKILDKIIFIVKKMNLKDGIFHIQIKFNKKKNKFLILEPFRRIPGDKYLEFVRLSTGYPVEENILKIFLNEKQIEKKTNKQNNFILRKIIMAPKNGIYKGIKVDKKLFKYLINKNIFIKKNKKVDDYLNQRLGIYFFSFKSKKELLWAAKKIDQLISVMIY